MIKLPKTQPALVHKTGSQVAQEIRACIGCNECILACPAVSEPITIDVLNRATVTGDIPPAIANFARACYQCGACVNPCPVGLHRDSMMMWLKVRLLRNG
jgi:Na+-translocating ferredoxin:NAD+ oxidoreductase RnfC subunit